MARQYTLARFVDEEDLASIPNTLLTLQILRKIDLILSNPYFRMRKKRINNKKVPIHSIFMLPL